MPDTRKRLQLPSDRDATGRDLGEAELGRLRAVIASGHLNSTGGTAVPEFECAFAGRFGQPYAIACASGTAAVHAAVGSLRLPRGSEVITTPITDMGAILPIHYERCVPVFADVDATTGNVTADTIAACITDRTRAVIVTHLFGMPCEMASIVALAREHELFVIEDCAQAFLAEVDGARIGTFGDLACFSFQQGKHMTTGEGGMIITGDETRADEVTRYVNKGWGYGDPKPDHDRPGLNYRMTELQAAVGHAQLEKLDSVVERRIARADELTSRLAALPGITTPMAPPGGRHAYWRYAILVDPAEVPGGAVALGAHLREVGIHNMPRYIQKPAYECAVFGSEAAVVDAPPTADCPGARSMLSRVLVLPWNEHYTEEHVTWIADEIGAAHAACREGS